MLAEEVRRRRQPAHDKTENRFSILFLIFIIIFLKWRQQQQAFIFSISYRLLTALVFTLNSVLCTFLSFTPN
jgi:hypothetical protein